MSDDLFHSSPYPNGFPHDDWSHVGSRAAAEDRVRHIRPADYDLPADTKPTLYTVRLSGRVYPYTLTEEQADEIYGAGHNRGLRECGLISGEGFHVFPYVSDTEDKGSICYLAHRSAIRVIRVERLAGIAFGSALTLPAG